jgi:hypothetical protein
MLCVRIDNWFEHDPTNEYNNDTEMSSNNNKNNTRTILRNTLDWWLYRMCVWDRCTSTTDE